MKEKLYFILGTIVLIAVVAVFGIFTNKPSNKDTGTTQAPSKDLGMQDGPNPWIAEIANLKARLKSINLPALTEEGTALHIHQHLDIFIDGQEVPVPADIGISTGADRFYCRECAPDSQGGQAQRAGVSAKSGEAQLVRSTGSNRSLQSKQRLRRRRARVRAKAPARLHRALKRQAMDPGLRPGMTRIWCEPH